MARPTWFRCALLGATAGSAILFAGGAAQGLGWSTSWLKGSQLWAGALASLLVLAARSPLELLATHIEPIAGPRALWRAMIVGAGALAFALAVHLDHRFHSSWSLFSTHNSFWELEPETFLAPMVATIAGTFWCRFGGESTRARPMRRWAWALAAVAAIATVFAGVRARRAPTANDYVASLPAIAIAPELGTTRVAGTEGTGGTGEQSRFFVDQTLRGDLVLRRYAFEPNWHCVPRLVRSASELPPQITRSYGLPLTSCGAVALRHDAAHGVYVLDASNGTPYPPAPVVFDATTLAALGEQSGGNARFADGMAVPRTWVWVAGLTLAIALLALLAPAAAARRLADRNQWRAATVGDDGVIRFADGASAVTPDIRLPVGPVVAFDPATGESGGPFRGAAPAVIAASSVAPGEPEAIADSFRASLDARDAFAAAAAAFAAAPLLAAATVGLLF